jgi:Domain of unknown function (DUF4169)
MTIIPVELPRRPPAVQRAGQSPANAPLPGPRSIHTPGFAAPQPCPPWRRGPVWTQARRGFAAGQVSGFALYITQTEVPAMIVNLNKFKKTRERAAADRRAAENRVRFGRSKAVRAEDGREREQTDKNLDGKRLE